MKVLPDLLHPRFPDVENIRYKDAVMPKGLPASPGAAVGRIAFSNENVVQNKDNDIPSIMVRDEVSRICSSTIVVHLHLILPSF